MTSTTQGIIWAVVIGAAGVFSVGVLVSRGCAYSPPDERFELEREPMTESKPTVAVCTECSELRALVGVLRGETELLRKENRILRDTVEANDMRVVDEPHDIDQLGLQGSERAVILREMNHERIDVHGLSEHQSLMREQAMQFLVSSLIGEDRMSGLRCTLIMQWEEYNRNMLLFASKDKFAQRLFGMLCYSHALECMK